MNTNDVFPSMYLKAADLPEEGSQAFTIESVEVEEIGMNKDKKPVISFSDSDKTFVCNKTNWGTITKLFGTDESDNWTGKKINLYRAEVEFGGEMVEAIRVSLRQPKAGSKSLRPDNDPADDESEVPF